MAQQDYETYLANSAIQPGMFIQIKYFDPLSDEYKKDREAERARGGLVMQPLHYASNHHVGKRGLATKFVGWGFGNDIYVTLVNTSEEIICDQRAMDVITDPEEQAMITLALL